MSTKTKRRLSRFADGLEAVASGIIKLLLDAIELILIDLVFGKGKYRKRGAKRRPIIHRHYNRTVYIRREMLPSEQGRVHIVK